MCTVTVPHDGVSAHRSADAATWCDVINRTAEEKDGHNDADHDRCPARA